MSSKAPMVDEPWVRLFDKLDQTDSMTVTKEEVRNYLTELDLPCDDGAIQELFQRCDLDRDGILTPPLSLTHTHTHTRS